MAYFNLQAIMTHYNLDKDVIGILLFPQNKFHYASLYRVLTGISELTADQVYILADFIGVSTDELYVFGDTYKNVPSKINDVLVFKKDIFTIHFNSKTGVVVIFDKDKPINYLKVLVNNAISVNELFDIVDKYVAEYYKDKY